MGREKNKKRGDRKKIREKRDILNRKVATMNPSPHYPPLPQNIEIDLSNSILDIGIIDIILHIHRSFIMKIKRTFK